MDHKLSKISLALLSATALTMMAPAHAQEAQTDEMLEVIEVTGIRASLTNALAEKRAATNLVEIIQAEDIGKLPDQNLAEVLENVTGIQITRTAGVGTGVQIRGTNANRTEINGVSTVGSGAGRSGINFEDISAAIISAVEVTKAPSAKTIEGSVGGTINLRTIRPLELDETLAVVRVQGENSSLSNDSTFTPRVAGTFGDNWESDAGEFGVVISASYAEQDVSSFRPRADRDALITSDSGAASAQAFDFLPIQFFIQEIENFEYETSNISGSFEWAPDENTKFFFDAVMTKQERRQESSRIQASGVSVLNNISVPDEFETINFGSLGGIDLGSIQAAARGVIGVDLEDDDDDPNLRFSSDTNSRITDSNVFRLGGERTFEDFKISAELSSSSSDSTTPSFNTTLNFINPNAPLDAGGGNDNSTPFEYDLTGGSLTFGIAQDAPFGPTSSQLLDPNNVVLRDVNITQDTAENSENAFRIDGTYYFDNFITSVDAGLRISKTSSTRDQIRSNVGLRSLSDSPRGSLFSDLLIAGPTNFNEADGRELYVRDFLVINPELAGSDPARVLATLQSAIDTIGGTRAINNPTSTTTGFFDIEEDTTALYAQANFEYENIRGNFGARYLQTDVSSLGNAITVDADGNEITSQVVTEGDYDFFLPRINIVADVADDVIVRAGWSQDIRRPDFSDLSTSATFSTSPNPPVSIGNPGLVPEKVTSFDISAEWYFAEASVASIGFFHKKRKNLFVQQQVDAFQDPVTGFRDITAPCEGGGVFNPIADPNVFAPDLTPPGVCVASQTTVNDTGSTTQKGIELAVQYDLSGFEDDLGWASGFGVIANYTIQDFSGGEEENGATSRASQVFAASTGIADIDVTAIQGLTDLSENAYNFTLYYDKYGISARARYTWREAYRTLDFVGTSSLPWGFPAVTEDRGQLNASVTYDVNEQLNIGLEAINLTKSDVEQSCVNEGALLCYQGLTDRRITLGATYRF